MPLLIGNPPLIIDASTWTGLMLYAATILLEAESESDDGKVAVAWVIRNRMDASQRSIHQVILGPDKLVTGDGKPFEAFSCWNDDYEAQRKGRLITPDPEVWYASWRAACAGYWKLIEDPTKGANHYLNVPLTLKSRKDGLLPKWAESALKKTVGITIGKHTFLKL